jgi:hypothetical protein
MDIKDLNKSQLILLAILLSFITSIATGITTVTLMQQAPESVTVPINRVIKQTVEKIQQVEGKTTVQTVIVKEEDLVVDAIAKNQSASFIITKDGYDLNGNPAEVSAGRGFAVTSDGVIVADVVLTGVEGSYYVKNPSGKFKADVVANNPAGFSFLRVGAAVNGTDKFTVTLPVFGDLSAMKIGQKVIVFGSTISSFIFEGDQDIKIAIAKSSAGGMVMNLNGEVLGIALFNEISPFVPINTITEAVKSIPAQQ